MKPKIKQLFQKVFDAHAELTSELEDSVKGLDNQPVEETADANLCYAEIEKLLDDLRKQATKLKEFSDKIICLRWAQIGTGEPIRTDYVTSSPRVTHMPKVPSPHKDPEQYRALCISLKIPEEIAEDRSFRPHWPSLLHRVAKMQELGQPLPDGLSLEASYPEYAVTRRKKRGVTILDD